MKFSNLNADMFLKWRLKSLNVPISSWNVFLLFSYVNSEEKNDGVVGHHLLELPRHHVVQSTPPNFWVTKS